MTTITEIELQEPFKKVARGKVRELYATSGSESLLFVTTDRISCFDIVLKTGIPEKGSILTQLSYFWFGYLQSKIPSLRTHLLDEQETHDLGEELQKRSMIVKRLKVFPIESIVRGYITGSAWSSYQKDGTMHGTKLPTSLQESERLEKALWTPSTKAEQGAHDENISPEEAKTLLCQHYPEHGADYADQIAALSLAVYERASIYAKERGIIIADTKLEFGLDESTSPPQVVLIDEVLTPDSSRFWSAEKYKIGRPQESFDKQPLRDWLVAQGLKGKEGVELPQDVVQMTAERYRGAYEVLTGKKWGA